MPESINFSTLARRALAEGLTTAELGRQIGLSQPAVSRLATGKTKSVAADVALRLIAVVGGSVQVPVQGAQSQPVNADAHAA